MDLLQRRELMDETLIIFVSDHGEEFLDHGTWAHGRNLFAATLNIPLVIRFPDLGHGSNIEDPVQQIDLMPTILDYLGIETDVRMEGRSLVPLVEAASSLRSKVNPPEPVFSYLHLDGLPQRSVVTGDWKLIQRLDGERVIWSGLFNRREDPGEAHNRIFDHPIRARHLELLLVARMAEGSQLESSEAVIDERTERALKALGYLQ